MILLDQVYHSLGQLILVNHSSNIFELRFSLQLQGEILKMFFRTFFDKSADTGPPFLRPQLFYMSIK